MPATLSYCQSLSATLIYCQLLSATPSYPQLLSATLSHPQLLSATLSYPQQLSATLSHSQLPSAAFSHPLPSISRQSQSQSAVQPPRRSAPSVPMTRLINTGLASVRPLLAGHVEPPPLNPIPPGRVTPSPQLGLPGRPPPASSGSINTCLNPGPGGGGETRPFHHPRYLLSITEIGTNLSGDIPTLILHILVIFRALIGRPKYGSVCVFLCWHILHRL